MIPMTNCAGVWSCAFENYGAMQRNMKIEARSWDYGWKCYDLETDHAERTDLGFDRCKDLHTFAMQTYGRLPGEGIEKPAKNDE
jgi:hypothetical protein